MTQYHSIASLRDLFFCCAVLAMVVAGGIAINKYGTALDALVEAPVDRQLVYSSTVSVPDEEIIIINYEAAE